jgi:tRNA (cytidine/uridine-2'-O-)-methyltransferase
MTFKLKKNQERETYVELLSSLIEKLRAQNKIPEEDFEKKIIGLTRGILKKQLEKIDLLEDVTLLEEGPLLEDRSHLEEKSHLEERSYLEEEHLKKEVTSKNIKGYEALKGDEPLNHPQVVLFSPQIPPNTGTIARLCAAMRCRLHLIEPLGFELSDRTLKRAGLDYWKHVSFKVHPSFEAFLESEKPQRLVMVETGLGVNPNSFLYTKNDYLVFGAETFGIPKEIIGKVLSNQNNALITIPMYSQNVRSLNLANTVSIILYSALDCVYHNP